MARRPGRASYEDLLQLPDHVVGELIDGQLIVSPRPAVPHAAAGSGLGADLLVLFQRGRGGPGGWWILDEPELHLGEDVLVPDVAGWRKQRMPSLPNTPAIELPPDWVCEILSPATARLDRTIKTRVYARARVGHLWMVDPLARTLEVFRLMAEHYVLVATDAGDERVRAEPFDAAELDMAAWWTGPEPADDAG
jgi:Uma2 family endonuclease